MEKRLRLHEEVLLLALRDEEGTIEMGSWYAYALGGAILAELMLENRLATDLKGKKTVLRVSNPRALGEQVLDDCLKQIGESSKPQPADAWVAKLAGIGDLKHRIARRLCDLGILRTVDEKVLLIFNRKTYPEADPKPERALIERLHQAIFTDTRDIEPRTVVLIALADSTGLLKNAFDKKELKNRKERISQIIGGEMLGGATKEAVEAAQATAILVAAIIPATITPVISS